MGMHFAATTHENVEKFWHAIRHSDDNPSHRIVLGLAENKFYPAVQALRDLEPGEELTVNFRTLSSGALDVFPRIAAIIADKLAAHDKAKNLRSLVEANECLYHANKKLSAENAILETKLMLAKRTINAMMSKISARTGETAGNSGQLGKRLCDAVRVLQTHSSIEDLGKPVTAAVESENPDVMMLTEQLKKLNVSNERLSNELVDLKKQHFAFGNRKKEAAGQKKH